MRHARYLRPTGLDDALAALAAARWTVIAGGTDHYPARVGVPLDEDLLDITGIAALGEISRAENHWRLPALVTWSDILADDRLPPLFDGLKLAARDVGGVQIQNAGTICGNLCNASPAADGTPNLLALDAEVELASRRGIRRLAVDAFVTGNRKTLRAPDELVTAVLIPDSGRTARSTFLKLGARRYLVISIVMIGAVMTVDAGGRIASAGIAVGACSAVAKRLPALELALIGQRPAAGLAALVTAEHLASLSPIDDVRGTADYRLDATLTLLRRAVAELCR